MLTISRIHVAHIQRNKRPAPRGCNVRLRLRVRPRTGTDRACNLSRWSMFDLGLLEIYEAIWGARIPHCAYHPSCHRFQHASILHGELDEF